MDNKFYKIGEIAKILDIAPSTLRYWENEFRQLKPHKSTGGQRFYTQKHIEFLQNLKIMLYEQKFTIDGAKKRLKEQDTENVPVNNNSIPTNHTNTILAPDDIRNELKSIISMLKYQHNSPSKKSPSLTG